jgi:hypothetical protein
MSNLLTTTEALPPRPAGSPRWYWQAAGTDQRTSLEENVRIGETGLFDTFEDAAVDAKAWMVSLRHHERPAQIWIITFEPQSVGIVTRF